MSAELDILKDLVLDLLKRDRDDEVRRVLEGQHPADIADVLQHIPHDERLAVFNVLDEETKPDVLAELEPDIAADFLEDLPNREISEIVEEMEPDDAADLLADFEEERSEDILNEMEALDSSGLRELLKYEEDSAGGIMTPSVVTASQKSTVQQAIDQLRFVDLDEPFYNIYIVDSEGILVGLLPLWELVKHGNRSQTLDEIMHRDIHAASVNMDQEEVAKLMTKYDLSSIAVVDDQGKLVGRVTVDDVMDVMEEEAAEDIMKMAGYAGDELSYANPLRATRARLPWLMITLITGFATSFIFKALIHNLEQVLVLSFFVPIVMAMGGNTGIQSSTLIIRRLAVGSQMEGIHLFKILMQEVLAALLMGIVCGGVIAAWATFLVYTSPEQELLLSPIYLGGVVGISLLSAMVFAAIFGAFTPILLHRLHIDPAVASGPFVTSSNDIFALLIYYGVTFGCITAALNAKDAVL